MANSLKITEHDFHFSFGSGTHNGGHWASEFPAEMTWLWRGYDPVKTEETYTMDAAEKAKPLFRIGVLNRDAVPPVSR
jgi:enterochelin esterase family protein